MSLADRSPMRRRGSHHLSIPMGNIAYHEFLVEACAMPTTPTTAKTMILDPPHSTIDAGMETTRRAMMDDAKEMQAATDQVCQETGRPAPPYLLTELIGKGSYGRVYKATNRQKGGAVVAIKMVDIEAGDSENPGAADTLGDIQKEISTLKLLRDVGAANVNLVIDAFMVAQSMWIVTDYCAGGSVATLMKPFQASFTYAAVTAGKSGPRLEEKWIIPILREVAEAVRWIHAHGVIHRDIKCANIFVTQEGGVQLGDFGVAAMVQTKFDKRRTVIGTLHWMAPELFDSVVSYGPAVDIWAFGAVAYEMASGLPPNAMESHQARVDPSQFGEFLNGHLPRLEGSQYSDGLKDLVSFCLEKSPDKRPSIERVVEHAYIRNTHSAYPTASLSQLVRNYWLWEQKGGVRQSLLNPNIGAQVAAGRTSPGPMEQDEWNFSTTLDFDQQIDNTSTSQEQDTIRPDMVPQPLRPKARRRPPPHVLARLKAPLESVFDPENRSDYSDNSKAYYGGLGSMQPLSSSAPDLPLRDDSTTAAIRESLIDLDASLDLDGVDSSPILGGMTIRPSRPLGPHPAAAPSGSPNDGAAAGRAQRGPPAQRSRLNTTPLATAHHNPDWRFPTSTRPMPRSSSAGTARRFTGSNNSKLTLLTGQGGTNLPPITGGDRGSLASLIDLDESSFGLTQFRNAKSGSGGTNLPPIAGSDRGSLASLIDLDESSFGLTQFKHPSSGLGGANLPPIAGGDRGSLASLIDLDESVFGLTQFKHTNTNSTTLFPISTNFPSTPPKTAHAPWSAGTMFCSDDGLTSSPFELEQGHPNNEYKPPSLFMETPPRHSAGASSSEGDRFLSPISDSSDEYGSGDGNDDADDGHRIDKVDGSGGEMLWTHSFVQPPSAQVMEGRASREAVAEEMKRLLGSLSGHLSDVGRQVKQLEPRRAEGARPPGRR
ncbi:Serine/threonine-protein kinase nak1 [Apiospora arundinis]